MVRNGLQASVQSHSIKNLEPLYGLRGTPPSNASMALAKVQACLELGDIEFINENDRNAVAGDMTVYRPGGCGLVGNTAGGIDRDGDRPRWIREGKETFSVRLQVRHSKVRSLKPSLPAEIGLIPSC